MGVNYKLFTIVKRSPCWIMLNICQCTLIHITPFLIQTWSNPVWNLTSNGDLINFTCIRIMKVQLMHSNTTYCACWIVWTSFFLTVIIAGNISRVSIVQITLIWTICWFSIAKLFLHVIPNITALIWSTRWRHSWTMARWSIASQRVAACHIILTLVVTNITI